MGQQSKDIVKVYPRFRGFFQEHAKSLTSVDVKLYNPQFVLMSALQLRKNSFPSPPGDSCQILLLATNIFPAPAL